MLCAWVWPLWCKVCPLSFVDIHINLTNIGTGMHFIATLQTSLVYGCIMLLSKYGICLCAVDRLTCTHVDTFYIVICYYHVMT